MHQHTITKTRITINTISTTSNEYILHAQSTGGDFYFYDSERFEVNREYDLTLFKLFFTQDFNLGEFIGEFTFMSEITNAKRGVLRPFTKSGGCSPNSFAVINNYDLIAYKWNNYYFIPFLVKIDDSQGVGGIKSGDFHGCFYRTNKHGYEFHKKQVLRGSLKDSTEWGFHDPITVMPNGLKYFCQAAPDF